MGRNFLAGVIHDLRLIPEHWSAHRAETTVFCQGAHDGERGHFGHAPELLKRCAEPLVPTFILTRGQVLGERDISEPVSSIGDTVRLVEKHAQRCPEESGHCRAILYRL